ncbi:hypothetical protein HYH03_009165 [Edaphochlamys debaryana]|uniref:Peptidase S9 prolyl oligopeptidase catalytic domain-containing protein n=1 Tax=Edaphochlamys debaryana TaxID=47281 RepID=A0A835Y4S5_9CHLO|nr:hypothetical protein HYH03_009165 [Edaphochlamys debaryana]|eukprot:KAG2492500.1 hypothetical protein HYH03_009165 [Edaphochlamys debaryana]
MGNRASRPSGKHAPKAQPREAPLGTWESPITSAFITEKAVKLMGPTLRPSDGALFWIEGRPDEGGRQVLVMRAPDGTISDVTPPPDSGFNARTTVHEYGGGDFCVGGGTAYCANFKDQALYAQDLPTPGGPGPSAPRLVTPGSAERGERFSDPSWDPVRRRLVAVSELHRDPSSGKELEPGAVINRIVAIDPATGVVTPLVSGADFYASPRLSPEGAWLSWVQWDFPNMPWDSTSLWVGALREDGTPDLRVQLAGAGSPSGPQELAAQQPVWSADGAHLYWVDDRSGWWNLYRLASPGTTLEADGRVPQAGGLWAPEATEALCPMAADWGFPMWTFWTRSYGVLPDGSVLGVFSDPTTPGTCLGLLRAPAAAKKGGAQGGPWKLTRLETGFTSFGAPTLALASDPASGRVWAAAVGAAPSRGSAVALLSVRGGAAGVARSRPGDWAVVRKGSSASLPDGYLSLPEAIEYDTVLDGKDAKAHMLYYPPANKDFTFPPGCLPPLLVKSHGGPTSATSTALNAGIQYWTSRGYAVADIDYGGSTGYGREYRQRLNGRWGVVDVQDCCAAALHLSKGGRVDPARLCISGGSAGGFTTLACLAFRTTFHAGASLYGVADLGLLAEHTHKFESRYLDILLGPYPQAKAVYDERSPLKHADRFSSPVIFFQGDSDKVVPPEQAIEMHAAIKAAGLPTALVMLKGEEHGFRQATNIRTALDGELFFYGAVLGFPAAMPPDLPAIPIDNPPKAAE